MSKDWQALFLLGLAASSNALPQQVDGGPTKGGPDAAKAREIKDAYLLSWNAYYEHAFPNDTLAPISNSYVNDRNRWGVTAVDSLSAAIIFEDEESVNQILEFIPTIDFTTTAEPGLISVFETNIRYVAGMLSAYDLLTLPQYKGLAKDESYVDALLEQTVSLCDTLKLAFDTPSGVPDPWIELNPEPRRNGTAVNNIAEAGTLVLEWTRLSDLTGDPSYAELTQRAESYMVNPRPASSEPFPGLVGTYISVANGSFTDTAGGWSGLTDSFYEYLIKMYVYDSEEFGFYKERWIAAAESTIEFLASNPSTREDLTFLAQYEGTTKIPISSHLASFAGGNFILGGLALDEQKYVDFGLELAESYFGTYRGSPTGIGPESFGWFDASKPEDDEYNVRPDEEDEEFYRESGYWARSTDYILRPETIESLYHAYRATGDAKYQDMAWEAFEAIVENTRAGSAYASLLDVTVVDGGFDDKMESFWITETLKYLYLLFTEDSEIQIQADGPNTWVYGTEAQPMRIRSNQ